MNPGPDERLEELLANALAALDQGGEAALEALLAAHPADRAALERGLRRARSMGLVGDAGRADFPDRLGDFRLLRRLGSGGMGIVFEAEQVSLRRRVALKLVRPELLWFEGARERFRREIDAVARLSHPGIVPILASGEQDGLPFYAMELLHGRTLQELVTALSGRPPDRLRSDEVRAAVGIDPATTDLLDGSWWQFATRIMHAVALGVRHAHLRGIVHRDIKPSNVMLTVDGRVVLLDFGVARVGAAGEFTRTGCAPGSPAFMSPEQLRGEAVDERTDVYSLGATLWNLLTLVPPFAAGVEPAAILAGDVPSPRRHHRELPRELEVVVARAMDRERERRYADVEAFAADLVAVLQRRPIRARRLGVALRMRRWCQRHRITSTAVAALCLAAVVSVAAFGWRERNLNRDLQAAVQRADEGFEAALTAIHSLLVRVGEDRLRYVPAARRVAIESLAEACTMYRRLLPAHLDSVRLRVDGARAQSRLADLLLRDGRGEEARRALSEGVAWLDGGLERDPAAAPQLVGARLHLHLALAQLHGQLGEREAGLRELAAADRDLRSMADVATFADDLRRAQLQWFVLRGDTGDPTIDAEAMERDYRTALALAREQVARPTADDVDRRTVVARLDALATLLARSERRAEAHDLLDEALGLARALPADARIWPPQPVVLSEVLQTLGNLLVDQRDRAAAPVLNECLELREAVAAEHPSDLMLTSDVAAALHNLGRLSYYQARDDRAVERLTRAATLQRHVLAELPTYGKAREYLINHLSMLGTSLANLGRERELRDVAEELSGFESAPVASRRAARLWLRLARIVDPAGRDDAVERAMQCLLAAERAGWGSGQAFDDDVYDALKQRPEFEALRARVAARAPTTAARQSPSTNSASRDTPR